MTRKVFFSFHYAQDSWRAAQVGNMGMVEGNPPVSDNDWEAVTRSGDQAIQRWIAGQLYGKSCAVVLIGAQTAQRPWVKYEIIEAWNANKGVVGIHIHNLLDTSRQQAPIGANPFTQLTIGGASMANIVRAYNPPGRSSSETYAWIREHLASAVEEAIEIRKRY